MQLSISAIAVSMQQSIGANCVNELPNRFAGAFYFFLHRLHANDVSGVHSFAVLYSSQIVCRMPHAVLVLAVAM